MKRKIFAGMLIITAVIMYGCSASPGTDAGQETETETVSESGTNESETEASEVQAEETKGEEQSEGTQDADFAAESQNESKGESRYKMIQGEVLSVNSNMSEVEIKTRDGGSYTLDTENADIAVAYDSTIVGEQIVMVYKGKLDTRKKSEAEVIQILPAAGAIKIDEITGDITDSAMSTFTIETSSGERISFLKNNCEGSTPDILNGDSEAQVRVNYVCVDDGTSVMYYPLKIKTVK